jgi:hypothetical protein
VVSDRLEIELSQDTSL